MNVVAAIGVDAETQAIADEAYGAEPLLAACVTVLLDRGVLEIETRNIGKIHSVLGKIGSPFRLVPADHDLM
jgi:hypothetical protein